MAEGDDVVELNYEQAELRLVEELADALDITLVIDPSIDSPTISELRPIARCSGMTSGPRYDS